MTERAFKFTDRDSNVLLTIYKHKYLTISQIQRIHFPSLQTAYRRMKILKDAGFVEAFSVPNIDESIFLVARTGLRVVADSLGVDISELQWASTGTRPKNYYFMEHFAAVNDFRIGLSESCDNSGISLLGFIPEYLGDKTNSGGMKKYIRDTICDISSDREQLAHTPDGVFALEKAGRPALFFLEIDRGTEVVSDRNRGVLKSIRFYTNYLLSGQYQRYTKDFRVESFKGFRSLYVTTTDIRIEHIRSATDQLKVDSRARRFLWLTTFERLSAIGTLAPIWVSVDNTDSCLYQIR